MDKLYGIIYSDPPWEQQKGNMRKCRPNQGKALDYPTMTVEECMKVQALLLPHSYEYERA